MTSMQLPWNVESEQSVLGALMQDAGALDAAQPLKASQFFDARHQAIYTAVEKIISAGGNADPIAVAAELGADLEACGGIEYLNALRESVPSARNIERYAQIVRDRATERGLLAAAEEVKAIVPQDISTAEKVDAAAQQFARLAQGNVRKMPRSVYDIAMERTTYYQAVEAGEVVPGWPTHIPGLDSALTGGFKPGKLVILAARPSVGKSSFAQFVSLLMARLQLPTLFLSMEMPEGEIADRGVASMGEVNYQALLTGKMSEQGWRNAVNALEEMRELPLSVDDQPALTLTDVKTKARSIKGLKFLVVDYLQLMQGQGDNRNAQIEEISRGLKALAKQLDICVLALSQLNRQVEQRANRRPTLSDLRDSGAIEQDADVVMFLWPVREFPDGRKLIGLGVDKNRQGKTCEFGLDFDGATQRWGESMEPIRQQNPAKTAKGFN